MSIYVQVDESMRVLQSFDLEGPAPDDSSVHEVTAHPVWTPPFAGAELHLQNGELVWLDTRTLAQAQAQRWDEIKAERSAREFGQFTWDGSTFDADDTSQRRIQGAVQLAVLAQMAGQGFSMDWTLADNSVRALDATDMTAVGVALGEHVAALHETGRLLRQAIDQATTVADVMAVVWP